MGFHRGLDSLHGSWHREGSRDRPLPLAVWPNTDICSTMWDLCYYTQKPTPYHPSIHLPIYASTYLCIYLSMHLSTIYLAIYLCIYLSCQVDPSVYEALLSTPPLFSAALPGPKGGGIPSLSDECLLLGLVFAGLSHPLINKGLTNQSFF